MTNHNHLRPEAGPIPYWKHHKRAQDSLNFIIRILKDSADSVQVGKSIKGDDSIDTNRASRIVLVSGEPGSGKSTLYLTLRAMLNPKEDEYQIGYENSEVDLASLKDIRWLDALDLEVAGNEGENLLGAVLVRLIEVLTSEDAVSNTVYSKSCDGAIKDLEELATDIGIAWEGNLLARAGELDPDTYSEEVMRTQRARLRVNERLKKALDKIAESGCYGCNSKTLFVLPVDDFYLKPDASLQLLRLLRMISIPRLFFLVMGDIDTIEALFVEKSLGDWTTVAGKRLFAERPDRLDAALTRARELRARYLRKLLPPGQRAKVEPMDWFEARDFEPGSADSSAKTIEDLLEEVKLDKPLAKGEEQSKKSLLTFLISPTLPSDENTKKDEKEKRENRAKRIKNEKSEKAEPNDELELRDARSAYTALQILDATPRELMDLGSALRDVQRKNTKDKDPDNPQLLLGVRDIVDLVKEEQSFLNGSEQQVLVGILPTRTYYPEDINFQMDRLCLKATHRTWKEQISGLLWIRDHRSWDLTVNRKFLDDSKNKSLNQDANVDTEQTTKDPFAKLPPRPAAWFILLHDLAWEWNPNSINENLIQTLSEGLNDWKLFVEDRPESDQKSYVDSEQRFYTKPKIKLDPSDYFVGWAVWYNEKTYKHFPMPDFKTFQDLDRFLYVWTKGIEHLDKSENVDLDNVLSLWALASWTILVNAYKNFAYDSDKWFENFKETTGTLEDRFKDFKGKLEEFSYPAEKDTKIQEWLRQIGDFTQSKNESSEDITSPSQDKSESTDKQNTEE